jgi:transposase
VDAQIKLSVVASDSFGVSGRAMLRALVAGERDPKRLAQLARARMRAKRSLLAEAFCGFFTDQHGFLLARMLDRVDGLSADSAALDTRIEALIGPFARAVDRLEEIPGVGQTAAQLRIAELGVDMARFPTAGHLVSWAKFAPGVKESAGNPKGTATTGHGNPYLARVLGEAAVAAGRTDSFLGERYRRIARRRGANQAIVAVGRSILVIVWHLLADPNARFCDLGAGLLRHPRQRRPRQAQPPPPAPSPGRQGHPRTRRLTRHPSTLPGPGFAALRRVLPPAHAPGIFGSEPGRQVQAARAVVGCAPLTPRAPDPSPR